MQMITTIEPTYRIDFETSERAIVLRATRVTNPAKTTEHRLNTVDAWGLINDLCRETHYQSTPNQLMPEDDWDLHKDWGTGILHLNVVGSNGRKQHVRLSEAEAWDLGQQLEQVYDLFHERGGVVA